MMISPVRAFVVLALLAALALSASGQPAGKDRVMSVITVEVKGDRDAYLQKLARLRAIQKRLGVPQFRVWRLTYAGQRTDVIHLMTEYDDLVHFSTASDAAAADPEWRKVIAEIEAGGTREVASRYLMVDSTPR
jgi:hypothetical protein